MKQNKSRFIVKIVTTLLLFVIAVLFTKSTILAKENSGEVSTIRTEDTVPIDEERGSCSDFKGTKLYDNYCSSSRYKRRPNREITWQEIKCLLRLGIDVVRLGIQGPGGWAELALMMGEGVFTCAT